MNTFAKNLSKYLHYFTGKCLAVIFLFTGMIVNSQSLTTEFINAGYTLTDLGSITDLPSRYGGLTIRPGQPNTLYICGYANEDPGAVYTVALVRDPNTHHITGFDGSASLYVLVPDNDGGLFFAQNGTMLFTRYSMNHLGQVLPDNTYVTTSLSDYGVASSVGSIALVPAGYPGAGNLIIASYNAAIFYNIPYTISGAGQYLLSNITNQVSVAGIANGPEGIAYVPPGSAGFPNPSIAVSSYGDGTVMVFEIGSEGLPNPETAREMVTGLTGAEGALIDPVTGDFLFSTFGGGDKVIRIAGFEAPSAVGDLPGKSNAWFTVYPNPTEGILNFRMEKADVQGTVEIFSIPGRQVLKQEFSGNKVQEFDLSSQPEGTYIICVRDGDKVKNELFIKR